MPAATTIGGWAAVLAVAGTYYWVSNQRKNKNRRSVVPKQSGKATEPRKDTKTKKSKKDGAQSSGDQDVKQGQKKKSQPKAQPVANSPSPVAKDAGRDDEEEVDNREFARQLSNAKRGVIDTPKSQASSRPKSVKQTRAQEKPIAETSSENATAPSSTTGGDADDDQSPITSPNLAATTSAAPVASGDVSDMLEKPADGPSVLRVTAPTKPPQPKKAKVPDTSSTAETKKQKQNRKKAEEKKLAREEEEKARKIQLEKHRRSVREAEGRAAKDGSAFMAANAPSSSAWAASPVAPTPAGRNGATPSNKFEPLDTFDPSNGHVTAKPADQIYSESELAGSKLQQELAVFGEDEQMQFAKEDSSKWEEVKAKQNRKKKAGKEVVKNTKDSKGDKQSSNDETTDFGIPPTIPPTGPGKKWDMTLVHVEGNGDVVEREVEVQDSEWEVA